MLAALRSLQSLFSSLSMLADWTGAEGIAHGLPTLQADHVHFAAPARL